MQEVVESSIFCCNILGFKFDLFGHLVSVCLERLRSKCAHSDSFGVYKFVIGYVLCFQ